MGRCCRSIGPRNIISPPPLFKCDAARSRGTRQIGEKEARVSESSPVSGASPKALAALGNALRNLHRVLVHRARHDYELQRGGVLGAGELLQLLTSDPHFAWLRSLSELIVDVDVFLEADPAPTDDEASAVRAEVERLIAPQKPATDSDFGRRYWESVHADPQVAIAHGEVRQALDRLPRPADVDEAQVLHERHRWTEIRRHRR
jgi:hypothetical protein